MAFGISAATAAVVGGGLAAAGAVGGALIGAKGAKAAADRQAQAASDANALQQYMYDQTREDQAPWRETGGNALDALAWRMGLKGMHDGGGDLLRNFDETNFQGDPGFQFRLNEGQKAIENSAAARGGILSGAALKAIGKYGQDYASNEYNNAFNRFNTNQTNHFNRLATLAGIGQTATNATQQAGQNYATNAGNNMLYAGNAAAAGSQRASGYIGQGLGFAANQLSNVNWGNYGGGGSAQTTPVTDYYAGTQPYATLS
ncbi:DNA transfer protein p32 [Cupriavidus necator]|uniref:DNA transfer protein p32 n=1 Tax=Cupriavidus necator TaxID=106590 RepID=UPI00148FA847|nr:DNA transfer protein p32 [Cupriavidus necator]NOV28009.1 DNA transfer protein p32 [Cupriavidus necator]